MKRSELFAEVARKCDIQKEEAEMLFEGLFNEIAERLAAGEEVAVHGFGKFITRVYNERKCYNPITGEIIMLEPSVVPVFKPGPKLRKKVNNDK